ncbi:hypothetical protein GCM10009745_41110 [Kribbella yunnanensis]|uniref:DUF885 domain-containing protein n=1 Tax=Kribbella yunnanensis TaxID=190194 RepID=A0ABN2HQ10_9ACTN
MKPEIYFNSFLRDYLEDDSELSTALGLGSRTGLVLGNGALTECTERFVAERISRARACLDTLDGFDEATMSRDEAHSRRLLYWYLQRIVDAEPYCLNSYPVHSRGGLSDLLLSGVSQQLPMLLIHGHAIFTRQDAFDYLSRLHSVPVKLEQLQAVLIERHARGFRTPALVMQRAIEAMRVHATAGAGHPLLLSFRQKLGVVLDISERERAVLLQMAASAIAESVSPAYGNLIGTCVALVAEAPESCSLAVRDDGPGYYRYLLTKFATTDADPETLYLQAQGEFERACDELRSFLGHRDLCLSPRWASDLDTSAEALLAGAQACIDEISPQVARDVAGPLSHPVRVEPMDEFMRPFAGQGYYQPPSCLSAGYGVFRLNPESCRREPAALRTLTVHETIPGHHLQSVHLYGRAPALPAFRLALPFHGYTEGWAVYAERLVADLGFYEGDRVGELGRLAADLRRSTRMLLDTGIHHRGWSQGQARRRLHSEIGEMAWLDEEIERVCIQPGEGVSYKAGELALLSARERARKSWGAKFDLARFHHRVLDLGPCPLTMLGELVVADPV